MKVRYTYPSILSTNKTKNCIDEIDFNFSQGLVIWVRSTTVKDVEKIETTHIPVSQNAERRMSIDEDDNSAESSDGMSSYSSVVIHHPVASTHTGHQTTSQWTIEDHKNSGYQRASEVIIF